MLRKIKETRNIVKNILKKRNYLILFLSLSILLFLILYSLTLATTTDHSIEIFIMMNGFIYAVSSFFLLAVISVLFGIYIAIFVFRIKLLKKTNPGASGASGIVGLIVGLFGAGCPMCGGVLFALIGMPLALFFLPFKGLELRVLSILLLGISVYFLGRSLVKCNRLSAKS